MFSLHHSEISEYKIFPDGPLSGSIIVASGIWRTGEGHFGEHQFWIEVYQYSAKDEYEHFRKVLGYVTKRKYVAELLGVLLLVTRLDRLARSTRDLLNVLDEISKRGAGFRSLKDTWADTTTPHGRLMLTVLGGLAEFERELIRARTGEGRK
jgi:DNA invertase Pin-like site-specific DNA recombinase